MDTPDPTHELSDHRIKSVLRRWRPLIVVALVLVVAGLLRRTLGIDWSTEGVRALVTEAGVWAPITFVALLVFRLLLVIPSIILLPAGGLLFGAIEGSIYGTIGLTLSGMVNYGLVQWAGPASLQKRVPSNLQGLMKIARGRAGAAAVAVISGYPIGPTTATHFTAAVSGMRLTTFLMAVAIGSAVRAATFSVFGAALSESEGIVWSSFVMVGVVVLPLLIPRSRNWLRQSFGVSPAIDD